MILVLAVLCSILASISALKSCGFIKIMSVYIDRDPTCCCPYWTAWDWENILGHIRKTSKCLKIAYFPLKPFENTFQGKLRASRVSRGLFQGVSRENKEQ